ncbi:hypothetical protein KKF84_18275, partial [Myxococcota bacterium]|nr:hypothetical protein [Myxococcota bacterium]
RFNYSRCVGATCGNGTLDNGEACEPGLAFSTTCRDLGFLGGTLTCSSSCQWNTTACNNIDLCGNGIADNGEACDGAAMNGHTCLSEGFYTGTVSCNADCTVNTSECSGSCGDGTLDDGYGEVCDGALLGANTCISAGFYEGTLACDMSCGLDTSGCTGTCGDGTMDGTFGESCDGTDFGGRTCYSGTFSCLPNCQINDFNCAGYCGDGVIQSGFESCDGANFDVATPPCGDLGFAGGSRTCELSSCTPEYNCLTWVKVNQMDYNGCALDSSSGLWCWGYGDNGNLGDGTLVGKVAPVRVLGPAGMGWMDNVIDFSVGQHSVCAVRTDGSVWCWGANWSGQLGDGGTTNSSVPVRVRGPGGVGYLENVQRIFNGVYSFCALKTDETLWCWGNNGDTQGCLGINSTAASAAYPSQVVGINGIGVLTEVKDLSLSRTGACGGKAIIGASRALVTWGHCNSYQQNPTAFNYLYPVNVKDTGGAVNLVNVRSATNNSGAACAVRTNGNVICWGSGILGNNQPSGDYPFPVAVLNEDASNYLSDVVEVSSGWLLGTFCARKSTGEVFCWGDNNFGQLGISTLDSPKLLPVPLAGPSGAGLMNDAASMDNYCLVRTDGSAFCWCRDDNGILGDGTNTYGHSSSSGHDIVLFPVPVLGSAP